MHTSCAYRTLARYFVTGNSGQSSVTFKCPVIKLNAQGFRVHLDFYYKDNVNVIPTEILNDF